MALEDLAMFRSIPGATVFYPSDAVSTERACELAAQRHGIAFIRTSRPATPVVYKNDTVFEVGKSHVILSNGPQDKALLIGAGITLHEAVAAAETLKSQNIHVRVLDPFTIKPLDVDGIRQHAAEAGNHVVVAEDHYPEGGIGEAVASALSGTGVKITHLAVREIPRSGPPAVLVDKYGIGAKSIVEAVKASLQ
jgi:transketolase